MLVEGVEANTLGVAFLVVYMDEKLPKICFLYTVRVFTYKEKNID